jgi:RNA polymerase sigma-70 factor (TIGR02943 family)
LQKAEPKLWTERYGDDLYNFAVYRISNEEAARDLVQDTFLSALKNLETFRGEASEKTWLFSILKRKVIDYYRKASNRLEVSSEDQKTAPSYEYFFNAEENEGSPGHWKKEPSPAELPLNSGSLESREFVKILNVCLSRLPAKWEAVFRLRLFEEEKPEEICKEMKLSPSNYWVILHRARLQLRECLEKNWFGNARL